MTDEIIKVPDIGSDGAEVIEVCVGAGDQVEAEDSLIVLESDKATMEVPAPRNGRIVEVLLKVGDKVSEGDDLLKMAAEGGAVAAEAPEAPAPVAETPAAAPAPEAVPAAPAASVIKEVRVPDIGSDNVPVIEVSVKPGDEISEEDPLVTLESDKATMEVPSPFSGVVTEVKVKEGDTLSQGDLVVMMEVAGAAPVAQPAVPSQAPVVEKPAASQPAASAAAPTQPAAESNRELEQANKSIHAGPAVRKIAREFGVDLSLVRGSGPRSRILKEDVQNYVKAKLSEPKSAQVSGGLGIPQMPAVDFSKWGEVEEKELTRLRQVAAKNFQRSWLNVPHVTQFDESDITELEDFRKSQKAAAQARGSKLTPLPFMLKACAYALKEMPQFCASLSPEVDRIIYKKYVNIGVAVDTPDGLLVPVIKDVDKKGLWELADECVALAEKARNKQLKPDEMQGGCFTISSLGSVGGTAFTPIVNAPEVAILGISKAEIKPKWNGTEFAPRLMLPLSLSYDHRAINGAEAARFTALLGQLLSDIRNILL
ncbi:dihydrolipoyllysine-residue acetyltransferase [Kistimonas scapharcae]|uniref:Acetyltransferase component of pyruvate dehydrogenase complex n=1 Tax=Kistimonas scapharcae TaxID=1036133 RepID=A0ABP8V0Y1_9GAMM